MVTALSGYQPRLVDCNAGLALIFEATLACLAWDFEATLAWDRCRLIFLLR